MRSHRTGSRQQRGRGASLADDIRDSLSIIENQGKQILKLLKQSKRREIAMGRNLDETLAAVEKNTTVEEGLYTLIEGLKQQAASAGLTPGDQAKIDKIFDAAEAQNARAAAVLVANTPADPGGSRAGIRD